MTTMEGQSPVLTEFFPEESPYDHMRPVENEEENALQRVTNLPLVANAWDAVSTYYTTTKKSYPSVIPYLELAEKLTTSAAYVALATTKPVVGRLAPTVNTYANRGLDKLGDVLPMIHDHPDEIYDSTKAAVASLVNRKLDSALSVTESYVDYYLPPAEEEIEDDSDSDSDDDSDCESDIEDDVASPKERLNVITRKVRERAYHRAMDKVRGVQKRSTDTLSKLSFTVDLIQYAKENIDASKERLATSVANANGVLLDSMATSRENVENVWKEIKIRSNNTVAQIQIMKRARLLTGRLQRSCSLILNAVADLPQYEYLRTQATKAKETADILAASLANKTSIHELSSTLSTTARGQIDNIAHLLDSLFRVLSDTAPLSWLAPDLDIDPLEGLFMRDLEADLHMHENYPANRAAAVHAAPNKRIRDQRG